MPINNQSLGKDITFTVVTATGTLAINGKTDYEIKPMYSDLKHKDLDGNTTYAYVPDGWSISMKVERRDQTIDNYFAQLESIRENDGSVSQFRYTNVVLKYDDAGNWKSDGFITVSLTGMATRRIRVS